MHSAQPYMWLHRLQSLERLKALKHIENLERIEAFERIENNVRPVGERLKGVTFLDWREVEIKPDSVVYCDIPYRGKTGYDKRGKKTWPDELHEEFYAWCRTQKELTLISEYEMPDDFVCVASVAHRSTLPATTNKAVTERLFVPKHQEKMYWKRMNEGTLFG